MIFKLNFRLKFSSEFGSTLAIFIATDKSVDELNSLDMRSILETNGKEEQ